MNGKGIRRSPRDGTTAVVRATTMGIVASSSRETLATSGTAAEVADEEGGAVTRPGRGVAVVYETDEMFASGMTGSTVDISVWTDVEVFTSVCVTAIGMVVVRVSTL
jgi:hypothetical protein